MTPQEELELLRLKAKARARAGASLDVVPPTGDGAPLTSEPARVLGVPILPFSEQRAPDPIREETRGTLVPFGTTESGNLVPAEPEISQFVRSAVAALPDFFKQVTTTAGDVATGALPIDVIDADTGETVFNPEVIERAFDMATMVTGPGPKGALKKMKPPSSELLIKVGKRQFDQFRKAGVKYQPDAVNSMLGDVLGRLREKAISEGTAPETFKIINEWMGKTGKPKTNIVDVLQGARPKKPKFDTRDVRALVRELQGIRADKLGKDDGAATEMLVDALYEFVENPKAANVLSGDAIAAGKLHQTARNNFSAGRKSGVIEGKIESAELQAAATNSGQNLANQARQKARQIVDPTLPAKRRFGFTGEELRDIRGVNVGTAAQNRLRNIGNRLTSIQGSTVGTATGGAAGLALTGTPIGAAIGASIGGSVPLAIGGALKGASARSSRKMLELIAQTMRQGSPLYKETLDKAGRQLPDALKGLLLRLGIAGTTSQVPLAPLSERLDRARAEGLQAI